MNKDRIAELLKEPARVAREDLAGLRELKERYPWFSGAHLLLALGENASGDVLFDETLRTTAAHVPSREVLMHEVADVARREAPSTSAAMPALSAEPLEAPATPAVEATTSTRDDLAGRILDQQIAEAAAAGVYDLEAAIDSQNARTVTTEVEMEVEPAQERPLPPVETVVPEVEATAPLVPRSFTAWLSQSITPANPEVSFVQANAAAGSAQDWLRGPAEEVPRTTAKPISTPALTKDLIDRFLQQSTPEPRKTEFFNPQQAGKRSLEERLDIVTETLARIHEKQGHWAKAAEAYRRLALKHPEKSGYFAALAKKAEQNLNS